MVLWHFAGLVSVIVLANIKGRIGRIGPLWMILIALPSTVLHEVAHFFIALITGGRPQGINLFPKAQYYEGLDGKPKKYWVLGSVQFYITAYSTVPSAMAPLLFIPLGYYVYSNWFVWFSMTGPHLVYLYLVISVFLSACIPSSTDFRVAVSNLRSLLLYFTVSVVAFGCWKAFLA